MLRARFPRHIAIYRALGSEHHLRAVHQANCGLIADALEEAVEGRGFDSTQEGLQQTTGKLNEMMQRLQERVRTVMNEIRSPPQCTLECRWRQDEKAGGSRCGTGAAVERIAGSRRHPVRGTRGVLLHHVENSGLDRARRALAGEGGATRGSTHTSHSGGSASPLLQSPIFGNPRWQIAPRWQTSIRSPSAPG